MLVSRACEPSYSTPVCIKIERKGKIFPESAALLTELCIFSNGSWWQKRSGAILDALSRILYSRVLGACIRLSNVGTLSRAVAICTDHYMHENRRKAENFPGVGCSTNEALHLLVTSRWQTHFDPRFLIRISSICLEARIIRSY